MKRRLMRVGVEVVTALALVAVAAPAARAQIDFSGEWTVVRSMDNTENPWVGDWVGLPLNPDGIARAESWDASLLSLPEYQCRPHGWAYIYRGPTQLRITKEVDPFTREVVAYQPEWHQSTNMPVYLDGRERPPADANHTWGGFSLATWEGDMLQDQDHAPERGLHPPQRRDGERSGHGHDLLDPARRHPDLDQHHPRPDLPGRAADSQLRVPPDRERAGAGAPLHVGVRRAGEGAGAALPARARTRSSRTSATATVWR